MRAGVNCSAVRWDHLVSRPWSVVDARGRRPRWEDPAVANERQTPPVAGELLELAVTVARRAAELVRARRAEGVADVGTKSTVTDLVTEADRAVERLIVEQIRQRRPRDGFLGEEYGEGSPPSEADHQGPVGGADHRGPVRWVVDPIDGTVNFVYGLPVYAVSIAAQVAGRSVAGVVVNAATGEEWTASRGGGAWRDGRPLGRGGPWRGGATDLGQALVATGFAYDAAARARQAAVVAGLLPRVRDIRRFGAASVDLCYVADGRFDAFFERGLNPWDHAAAGLVAVEAGLLVTGLRGAPPGGDMVLAAPPALHGPLHDLLVSLDA
jgi:myo-inositol-1(or 4)-monophosphatase